MLGASRRSLCAAAAARSRAAAGAASAVSTDAATSVPPRPVRVAFCFPFCLVLKPCSGSGLIGIGQRTHSLVRIGELSYLIWINLMGILDKGSKVDFYVVLFTIRF
jgi:hypothetical protein